MSLCERFHCLPSQVMAEDVKVFRYLKILELAGPEGGEPWPTW